MRKTKKNKKPFMEQLKRAARHNNIALALYCGIYGGAMLFALIGLYGIYCGLWILQG